MESTWVFINFSNKCQMLTFENKMVSFFNFFIICLFVCFFPNRSKNPTLPPKQKNLKTKTIPTTTTTTTASLSVSVPPGANSTSFATLTFSSSQTPSHSPTQSASQRPPPTKKYFAKRNHPRSSSSTSLLSRKDIGEKSPRKHLKVRKSI